MASAFACGRGRRKRSLPPLPSATRQAKAASARGRCCGARATSKRVRNSLRHAVKEVNDALLAAGFDGFIPGKLILSLARSQVVTDLDAVMEHAAKGRVHPRLLDTQCLADTLLANLETVDPAFQVWVHAKRHALHDRLNVMLGQRTRGCRCCRRRGGRDRAGSRSTSTRHMRLGVAT